MKYFIFSSSCAVYGIPDCLPLTEAHKTSPINPYGKTKLMVENILEDFRKAYGLEYVALRYFNAAGAMPELGFGERHEPETHLIPLLMRAAMTGKKFTIFGIDYPTPDGTCIRDYLHIADLATAHWRSYEYLKEGNCSAIFNLGTGVGVSVREMIQAVQKTVGSTVNISYGPRRPGDPAMLVADAGIARRSLGWIPEHSSLESIIQSAYQFEMQKAQKIDKLH